MHEYIQNICVLILYIYFMFYDIHVCVGLPMNIYVGVPLCVHIYTSYSLVGRNVVIG